MRGSSDFRPLLRRLVLGFAAAGLLAGGAFSQEPQSPPIRVKVDVVGVGVSVTDAQGHFASGLSRENFRVFDNGADRKSTRLNSSHGYISYAVFCLKKKKDIIDISELRQ